ncbi:DUF19 domain-containing protein [Caerostris extrusa]|uniref:DUF19 domain-containing protein n=1 Tax=Caerostris extrusa TaxID=172846 RepID=A0AAV4W3U2_CAEEX|nr:DUF19 domain-containing protein [Caerostris extrusa]
MQLKVVILLAILATVSVQGDEDCGEEKAGECVERLLATLLRDDDVSEEEVCSELRAVADCLRDAADECLGDDRDPEIDEGLKELDDLLQQNCPTVSKRESDDLEECVKTMEDDIMDCIADSVANALEKVMQSPESEVDENELKCSMYNSVTTCIVDKIEAKCGEEAGLQMLEEMLDIPDEIKEACDSVSSLNNIFEYEIDKKKKK